MVIKLTTCIINTAYFIHLFFHLNFLGKKTFKKKECLKMQSNLLIFLIFLFC